MRDTNLILRQAYYNKLNGNIIVSGQQVPVYYMFVPQVYPDQYVLINAISSIGRESKVDTDADTSIQFAIFTRKDINSGWECDKIADMIFLLCYPDRGSIIPGCLSIDLVSDITRPDYDPGAKKQIIERFITFRHIIQN